jgi:integrase
MASIHRQKGRPYWFYSYFDQDGKRRHKSSKSTNRKEAEIIAASVERNVRKLKHGPLSQARARELVEELYVELLGPGAAAQRQSTRQYFLSWMDGKSGSVGTLKRYRQIANDFLKFLKEKADAPLQSLGDGEIQNFRDHLKKTVSTGTVNTYLKVIRVCMNKAAKKGAITFNPARAVDNLERTDKHQRRPFTLDEFKKLFDVASADWRTMMANGLYTGLRLSDCARLTAANLDLLEGQYSLTEKKTKKSRTLPIAKPLLEYLTSLDLGDDPAAPLCPGLYGKKESWLSNQFYELMASVGMVPKRKDHQSTGKGRGSRRTQNEITFHSLRYTATSLLKNAGVSDIVARDIIGHESAAVSRNYTVIDDETKRGALNKLPKVLNVPKGRQMEFGL